MWADVQSVERKRTNSGPEIPRTFELTVLLSSPKLTTSSLTIFYLKKKKKKKKRLKELELACKADGVSISLLSPLSSSMAVKHGPRLLTLKKRKEKRIEAFETRCTRKLLRISYLEHMTKDWVRSKINSLVGPQEPLLSTVNRRKLAWIGHVTHHDSLSKTILQGTCLLYTSPSPRDINSSRMPSSA